MSSSSRIRELEKARGRIVRLASELLRIGEDELAGRCVEIAHTMSKKIDGLRANRRRKKS